MNKHAQLESKEEKQTYMVNTFDVYIHFNVQN